MNETPSIGPPSGGLPPEDCSAVKEQLHDWVDRELDRDVASVVAKHVDGCHDCAEVARSIQHLKTLLRTKATEVPIPPRLESKVREAIALETLRAARKKVIHMPVSGVRWAAAATILIVMGAVTFIGVTKTDLHAQVTEGALQSHLESLGSVSLPRFQCLSRKKAEKSLFDQLGVEVRLPEFPAGRVCIRGVSLVSLKGHPAGKVFYHLDGGEFSLFVVAQKVRGGDALCCCESGPQLKVFCSNEGKYCFIYVTELDGEAFRTQLLEPALKRAIEFPSPKPFSSPHPEGKK